MKCKPGNYYCYTDKKCKPIPAGFMVDPEGMLRKENGASIDEGSLHKWFKSSKSKEGKPGWVNVVTGGTCASDKPGEGTPKCVSSAKRASMTPAERRSAARRKKAADPGQQQKTGAAKPTYVSTDKPKKKMNEAQERDHEYSMARSQLSTVMSAAKRLKSKMGKGEGNIEAWVQSKITKAADYLDSAADYVDSGEMKVKSVKEMVEFTTLPLNIEIPSNIRDFNLGLMFRESLDQNSGMYFIFEEVGKKSFHMTETKIPLDIAFITEEGIVDSIKELEPYDQNPVYSEGEVLSALEVNRGWFEENNVEVGDEIIVEQKDVKGKGSGKKDACYHKVKSRYRVWPSAYASGALVKCRKAGASNWGQKEGYEFSNWRDSFKATEYESIDIIKPEPLEPTDGIGSKLIGESGKKCWKGYEKTGTQKLFGKTYNRCVKKEEAVECNHTDTGVECPIHGMSPCKSAPKGGDCGKPGPAKNYVKPMGESVNEAVRIPAKTGNIIMVTLTWRGKYYGIKMFFPQVTRPSRKEIQDQINKVYPGAKVLAYNVSEIKPGEQFLQTEDWQSVNRKDKTDGLSQKAVDAYRRENPGSKLQTAVTEKKPTGKRAERRKSFCRRMKGMKSKLTSAKTSRDPDSRINKALRRWRCN